MNRYFFIFLICCFFSFGVFSQITVNNDTLICDSSPVLLYAEVNGSMGTSSYSVDTIGYSPDPYNGTTPVIISIDDSHSSPVSIGFDFCFYGNVYNQVVFSTNNYITFDLTQAGQYSPWVTMPIPDPNEPTNAIMGPWVDIDPSIAGGFIFQAMYGTAPYRRFVASYYQVPYFQCNNLAYVGQITIYETTNVIETHIENMPICSTWNSGNAVHGIHGPNGLQAVVVPGRNNTSWGTNNESMRWTPTGISWYDLAGNIVGTGDSITVIPDTTTTYYALMEQCVGGAIVSDTVTISIGTGPASIIETDETCFNNNDGEATVNIPPGNWSVTWTDASGSIIDSYSTSGDTSYTLSSLSASAYHLNMFDSLSGCLILDTAYINQPPPIDYFDTIMDAFCDQAIGEISVMGFGGVGTGNVIYMWSTGDSSGTITDLMPGDYSLTMYDEDGCDTTVSYTVNNIDILEAIIDNPLLPEVLVGDLINLTESSTDVTQIDTYTWYIDQNPNFDIDTAFFYTGQIPPPISFSDGGDFAVVLCVMDSITNCEDCDTLRFTVISESCLCVPNVFTPDGNYNRFNIITAPNSTSSDNCVIPENEEDTDCTTSNNLLEFEGYIYNRWGKKIYEWQDWENIDSGWDGMIGSKKAPSGTYFVVIKATTVNDSPIQYSGHFNLFRKE